MFTVRVLLTLAIQSNGAPFEILAPDTRMVFVSAPEHIKELDNAADTVLSLNGAAKHVRVSRLGLCVAAVIS